MRLLNFKQFVDGLNESALITEAFNSTIMQKITSNKTNGLGKQFYGALSKLGIAASEITNADITPATPQEALDLAKENPNLILIFYSSTEKDNPYSDYWNYKKIQADVVMAVVKGKSYMGLSYDKWASKKGGKSEYILTAADNGLGIDDKSKSKYGSGLNTLKKMASVCDIVYVIDPDKVASSKELRANRVEARKGAIAFVDDKDFKAQNKSRYEAILATRASLEDIDKMVSDAIDTLTEQIKKAIAEGKKGSYGEILIGTDKKGREIRMSDAGNTMSHLLSDYSRWANDKEQARASKEKWGEIDNYYEKSSMQHAKEIKDRVRKIEDLNYAW
jgi:hypothetical protein